MKATYLILLLSLTFIMQKCSLEEKNPSSGQVNPMITEADIKTPPNILWISCEDISPRLGCYGDSVAQTPNIDQLATQGMKFNNVYTSAPVCAPCRSGIITGMYQTTMGTMHMRTTHTGRTNELPTPYVTVPQHYVKAFTEYLRAAGYYCTNNSKTDYQFAFHGDIPVTIWDESSTKAHYKNRPDKEQPFFAVFNYTMTHESQTWQEPSFTDPDEVAVPPYYPDTEPVRKSIARLYDQIAKLDTAVGNHLRALKDEGLDENTIVFFWSDHGDGLPRGKRWTYDSGTKVPLIVRWPEKIKAGLENDDLINSIDFGPTVLSLAGVPIPSHMQGKAFLGPQKSEAREYVVSARDRFDESYDMVRSVRDAQYRYVRNFYPNLPYVLWIPYRNNSPIMQELLRLQAEGKLTPEQALWMRNTRPPEELYDCKADPFQLNNLADDPDYQHELVHMRRILNDWRDETNDMGDIAEYEMRENMWPDGIQPTTDVPHFIPNAAANRGQSIIDDGGTFDDPFMLKMYCATQGASIAYSMDTGENPDWKLYAGPIDLKPGRYTVRAKAIRYGFKHSEEQVAEIIIR